jgi:hypothetical protein
VKGIVINLLEEAVRHQYGEASWDAILDEAGVDGAYTSLGSYADEEFRALLAASSRILKQEPGELLTWFGRQAIVPLSERYPRLFAHPSTRSFLLSLNNIIHPEVRKLYPGADVPHFDYLPSSDDRLLMKYASKRRMCAFAEGLIEGAAEHFGERVSVQQEACMLKGDPHCLIVVIFTEKRNG